MSRWLMVPLMLLAACSSPLRESSEPAERASEPVVVAPEPAPSPSPPPPEVVAGTPVVAADPAPSPAIVAPAPEEKTTPVRPLVAPDPVKLVLAEEEQRVEREKLAARLEAERDEAAVVVARREKDLLAFKNPFLPRPQLAPDEAEEIKGLGGAARAQWAERRVAEAKAKLEAVQKAYDDAKANP